MRAIKSIMITWLKNGIPLEYKQYRGHGYGQQ